MSMHLQYKYVQLEQVVRSVGAFTERLSARVISQCVGSTPVHCNILLRLKIWL